MKPPSYEPMLATRWPRPFTDPGWWFEVKWDGVRVLLSWDGSEVEVRSRRGTVVTSTYPELAAVRLDHPAVLDGEVVAFGADGRPSFQLLQSRMNLVGKRRVAEVSRSVPTTMVVFDLLFDGGDLSERPLEARLARLDSLQLPRGMVRSDRVEGEGEALFQAVQDRGLEGIVAKRLGSIYRPGVRSPDWRKVAAVHRIRAVVGGFLPGEGRRRGAFGSLLVGLFRPDGLRWIGSVGTGFDDSALVAIREALEELRIERSPFLPDPNLPGNAVWVTPSLVAQVEYKQWTQAQRLRAPSFKGFTLDPPESVTWKTEGPEQSEYRSP